MSDDVIWGYLPYHIVNYLLAALMYTLIGRMLLGIFVPPNSPNYIWRFFVRVTDPVLDVVRPITPRFVIEPLLPLVAVFWIIAIRIIFWIMMAGYGLVPNLPQN